MQLRDIHYFITIVEEGSLSKAAEKLFITQPTLSHFLGKLQQELGAELFQRKGGRLQLTASGQTCYEAAKKISFIWKDLECQLNVEKCEKAQHIRCGTGGNDLVLKKLNLCLPQLRERFHDVRISTVSKTPPVLEQMLLNGELDFVYSAYTSCHPDLNYIEIADSEVDLVVPPGDRLAEYSYQLPGNENVRIPLSLAGEKPFALVTKGSTLRAVEDAYFSKIEYTPKEVATYSIPPSVREYVCSSGFYGLCARIAHCSDLVYIALDPPMHYTCGIYYRKGIHQNSAVKFLISLLRQYPFDYTF